MLSHLNEYCNAAEFSKHSGKTGTYAIFATNFMAPPQPASPTDQHPLAGSRMSGADIVVQVLADENVDTVFGYSGGAILPTYDAVFPVQRREPGR